LSKALVTRVKICYCCQGALMSYIFALRTRTGWTGITCNVAYLGRPHKKF